jgi:hypothetical protein
MPMSNGDSTDDNGDMRCLICCYSENLMQLPKKCTKKINAFYKVGKIKNGKT